MGEVYKAHDTRLNRTIAIKLLREDLLGNAEHAQRLEREARAIAGLNHPNICVLHDIGQHVGARYLVMEFLEGETLADRLRRGPLPERQALTYARDIAAGLTAAHARGIVHRDLKPSNVMLTKTGAKLVDFGLAKAVVPDPLPTDATSAMSAALTGQWQIVGTLPYMAPERLQGRLSDARGDIFAFGALLYEMLAGHPAFGGDNQAQIIASVLKTDPPPIGGVSPALDRVIRRCLAKDQADRWREIGDVAEALALATDSTPPAAPARGSARGWLLGVAIIAVAIAAGTYFPGAPAFLSKPRPVVVLMDSTLPERIYDPATRADGGTNSDDITDTLRDLPLELHKETTSAQWHREDQVVQQHPALVMMHLSSFAQAIGEAATEPQLQAVERLRAFLGFVGLANPRTQFIVYTRGFTTEDERRAWVSETVQRFPALRDRVRMISIPGHQKATFRDPATRRLVRQQVASILHLE
jgi:serine/threonine protein kinase